MKVRVFSYVLVVLTVLFVIGCGGSSGDGSYPDGLDPNYCELTMVSVPGGTFQRDGTPGNTSTVRAFRISKYEITRAQFKAVMGVDPSIPASSTGTEDPVSEIYWYRAIAFCNKKSIEEGLTPVYSVTVSGTPVNWNSLSYYNIPSASNDDWNLATADWGANGYRLPTEMEWMWAAMGAPADGQNGGTNTTGYAKGYAGSTEGANQGNILNYIWCYDNAEYITHPIGKKFPNELGLYDMNGNVREWCWDWYASYPTGALPVDYRGPTSGTKRVVRGGSIISSYYYCTVDDRDDVDPGAAWDDSGFRVARN
jgi:formylglycine-generating enzyme required for sulfatase activity